MRSSQLGPENCTATVAILSNTVTVYDATFLIGNSPVSEGSVVNGTLVVSVSSVNPLMYDVAVVAK